MSAWILLALAVVANISTNVSLKTMMAKFGETEGVSIIGFALTSPYFWIGGFSGLALLGTYLAALRTLELSMSYAIVTSGALVGISLVSMTVMGESANLPKVVGIALVVLGIILISANRPA